MSFIFKKLRGSKIGLGNVRKYFIYALGEICIIIAGVLVAVQINNFNDENKSIEESCLYLDELRVVIINDSVDIYDNIGAFDLWNDRIISLIKILQNDEAKPSKEIYQMFGTVGNYIFFGQQSKSKIDELIYSSTELIPDRTLKDSVIFYQNGEIFHLRETEKRYEKIEELLRDYYSRNFDNFNYSTAIPNDFDKVVNDKRYLHLVIQRLRFNMFLRELQHGLLKSQREIIRGIDQLKLANCQ